MKGTGEKKYGVVVTHTHWDREWRYPLWENRMYLADLLDELIGHLEENPGYTAFLLDGQVVPVYDYLQVRPQMRERLLSLIQGGRIQIGPWYTLPDLYPVSGESLVRNLLRGHQLCEELGAKPLSVGYESFGWGQPSQFPQIYAGFGIDTVIVAKNIDKSRVPSCEFIWRGKDGTDVLATRLGGDARANFFMNTYLEAVNGAAYKTEEYRYNPKSMGLVYHAADGDGHVNDYFRLEDTRKLDGERAVSAFAASWRNMDGSLLKDERLLMSGTDSTSCQTLLEGVLNAINHGQDEIELVQGDIEGYSERMKSALKNEKLVTVQGELRDGPATSLSANALMTRPHIKKKNRGAEKLLYSCAEPFQAVSRMLGRRGEGELLALALDYMLLSHPHDSINGVTQDKTVRDVMYRLDQAEELSQTAYTRACQDMLSAMSFDEADEGMPLLVVFNPLPFPRREMMHAFIDTPQEDNIWDFSMQELGGSVLETCHLSRTDKTIPVSDAHARPWPFYADRHEVIFDTGNIPAGGYKTYKLADIRSFQRTTEFWAATRATRGDEIALSPTVMENEHLRVEVMSNGTVSLLDKASGRQFSNLNYFESTGDVGDYWIYYPPYHNETYTSKGLRARICLKDNTSLQATITAEIMMELPAHGYRPEKYHKGDSRRSSHTVEVPIITRYTLKKGARQLDVCTEIQNTARDHRMSAGFDCGIQSENVFAQGHFCVDERPRIPLRDEAGCYYNELMPQPMQDFVCAEDEKGGFAIVNRGMCEYEAKPGKAGTLFLTLFRSVRNIICTEQRSAGEFPNQDGGQLLQTLRYEYALCPYSGSWESAGIPKLAQRFNVPAKPVQTVKPIKSGGSLPAEASFYELDGELSLSACKHAEKSDSIILRVYNPLGKTVKGDISLWEGAAVKEAYLLDMKESRIRAIPCKTHGVSLNAEPDKILSVELVLDSIKTAGEGE